MIKTRQTLILAPLTALFALCAALLWLAGDGRVSAVEPPEVRPSPEPYLVVRSTYVAPDPPDVRVGDFERPGNVPVYEILQTEHSKRDGVRGVTLIVDTRVTTERDLTLVARDIKGRYAGLDSVSVEFIDSDNFLNYSGGAVIFNTAAGAHYQGFVYGPPNNEGYLVRAAD